MPNSWNKADIILTPKPNKDHRKVESLRPIRLLNEDDKILASILEKRINTVLGILIHTDQMRFIKGRQLKDNIRKVLNIMNYALDKKLKRYYFSDAKKAFNRVEWFLMKAMVHRMGLGSNVITWMESAYKCPTAWNKMNNLGSQPLVLSRGI